MKITFDAALDGAGWAGPLGRQDHVFGEIWVGPLGLLALLETRLGLGGGYDKPLQRACRLAALLQAKAGYWRSSFDVNPLGATKRLLRDRDLLCMWGWKGQPLSSRFADLRDAVEGASPGIPDRLRAISGALACRTVGIDALVSYTTLDNLPPAWRAAFQSLKSAGVSIEERQLGAAPALGDLANARTSPFEPAGDGRVCLLRRHGPLELADEVAAALAACDSLEGVVVIGADAVLDGALVRHGLPRSGTNTAPTASSRLLPLVLEAAFHPMDIDDLHALVAMDPGPIPRSMAAGLISALQRIPGRRTADWKEAIAKGLEHTEEARRAGVERRISDLLMPMCARTEALAASAVRERLDALQKWARERAIHAPSLIEVVDQTRALAEALDLVGVKAFSRDELRRLCEDLGEVAWSWQPAQLGLAHVSRPGAILGPARSVVWWNFSRDSAPRPERLLLSLEEQHGLRTSGAEPPDASLSMAIESQAWRRPLTQAQHSLILACSNMGDAGDTNHPHPLWDEITASLDDLRSASRLEREDVLHPAAARTKPIALRPLVAASPTVTIGAPLVLREIESPSSLERLLGCSLAWALDRHAHLRPGLSFGVHRPGPLLFGTLAHRFLQQVLVREPIDSEKAGTFAATLFDEQIADLCEVLALPQHQAGRATLRRAVVESARELARLAAKHGTNTVETEVPGRMVASGLTIEGRLDVVWDRPAIVLDLKWGKRRNAERLQSGTAMQLAAYAAMREVDGRRPETAYFVLQTQDVLAEPGGLLGPEADLQGQHASSQVWSAAVSSIQRRREELSTGHLEAPGAVGDLDPSFSATALQLSPPCRYCSFGALCGRGGAS